MNCFTVFETAGRKFGSAPPKKNRNMMAPIGVCQDFPDFWQISENALRWSGDKVRGRIAIKIYF